MRAFVGVTDRRWYEFLRARPELTEVNFWRPSGRGFGAISSGEPFLFKTHHPDNQLVGAGLLSAPVSLRLSEAWDIFGEANGVSSHAELRAAIGRYRAAPLNVGDDPEIGCILLREVTFTDSPMTAPPDFAGNIVVGKTYDLEKENGSYVEVALRHLLRSVDSTPRVVPGEVFGTPRLAAQRLGQKAFRALVLAAYQRRCAITGEKIRPVLEAAHIRPVDRAGQNRVDNGILLRSDLHTLFDRGYVGVGPDHRIHVSPRLRSEFGNGESLYRRHGETLTILPARTPDRPDREALEWHMDVVFQAS